MKKLMTSLLAVLLCGFSLCWAQPPMVSGTVTYEGMPDNELWTTGKVIFKNTSSGGEKSTTLNTHTDDASANRAYSTYVDMGGGTYDLTFTGEANGKTYTYEQAGISITQNMTINIVAKAEGDDKVNMVVYVVYPSNGNIEQLLAGDYISGASVTFKASGEDGNGTTLTTEAPNNQGNPLVTFKADASKTYTITATATGFKEKVMTDVTPTQSLKIPVEPVTVTVQGTVKLGETLLTELPEGMTLQLRTMFNENNTVHTVTVNADGYKAENVKVGNGEATMKVMPENNYSVTTPTGGNFTIADNDNHTVTQNIVISKTAATIFIKTNPEDNINYGELYLTGENLSRDKNADDKNADGTFVFNGIAPGTYTIKFEKFLYKLKGETNTVTIGADCADQTVNLEIEAGEETVTIEGIAKLTNNYQPVPLKDAEVKLYAVVASASGYEPGELLDTKTTGEDGKFSFSQTVSKVTSYIITVTHNDILPFSGNVTVTRTKTELSSSDLSLDAIWISGNITNLDALVGDPTVTVTCNGQNNYYIDNIYAELYTKYDNGKYYIYSKDIAHPGTFKVTAKGKDINGYVMTVTEDVTITDGAVTKDLTPAKDENSGYMTIRLKYRSIKEEILSVEGSSIIKMYLNDATDPTYLNTDKNGNATVLVTKNDKCKLEINVTSLGYQNKTLEEVNCFFTDGQGTLRPTDTTIYLSGVEAKSVTVSGHVAKTEGLGSAVRLALETQRDHVLMYSDIAADGLYRFENVPVVNSDNMNVFLVEEGGKYNADYNVTVPYNYAVNPQSIYARVDGPTNIEQELTVYQIACNVSGTVSPATSYEVSLTPAGETRATYSETFNSRNFKFQGVTAGTYTLNVKADGYELYSSELKIDARELKDITLEAITLTSKAETITVTGKIDAYNKATHEYFDGAKLSIWNSEGTEKIVEVTMPEDAYGYIPSDFKFQATMGTEVLFKMEHPSIKPISKTYTVNATTLPISNLPYEFVVEGADWIVMTDFKAEWNTTLDSLKLSWKWPANAADAKIRKIDMKRRLTNEASSANRELTYWASKGASFAANELPVAYTDTVSQTLNYTYTFDIYYIDAPMHTVAFKADMRDGERYKLAYSVNDDKMGTISSYSQPEGEYMEGDQITLTAKAKEGYKFVEFLKNGEKLSEAEIAKLTLQSDTVAIYGFKMPAEDVTIKAIFASRSGNVDPETKEYTVTLKSSNEAWGTVSGAGKFEEGKEIEVKATVTDEAKYEFVAWKEGDKEVSKDATYKFKVEKDITLTAVFKEKVANENLKAARWAIFAEDGAIVIKGINGDRYDIYDLNGHHCGAALCTGAEIRLNVAKSKLYIVRRLGADGSFDAKKIVVR